MAGDDAYDGILVAARTGAEWAWTRVYRELAPHVLRYLRAHGAKDPDDLLGDVFVQVVRRLDAFSGGWEEFRAWVFTIARNRLIDSWRRLAREGEAVALEDGLAHAWAPVGDVESDVLCRVADDRVREIIASLAPQQRDVMFLRVFARLTIEEVAQVMGKSPGAVKSIQTRAFAAIRTAISDRTVTL